MNHNFDELALLQGRFRSQPPVAARKQAPQTAVTGHDAPNPGGGSAPRELPSRDLALPFPEPARTTQAGDTRTARHRAGRLATRTGCDDGDSGDGDGQADPAVGRSR